MECALSADLASAAALTINSTPFMSLLSGVLVLLGCYVALIAGML